MTRPTMNRASLIGFLQADPFIADNGQLGRFIVVTYDRWEAKNGEFKDKSTWHFIVVVNRYFVTKLLPHLRKGSYVHLEGTLETHTFVDSKQVERTSTEVVLGKVGATLRLLDDPDVVVTAAEPAGDAEAA